MKRPTQRDVARLAGVSRTTVSYVMNGQTDGNVSISEETRIRVMDAIAELGYEPDARAQALRSGDTHTIGLIIPDIRNPHFWQTAEHLEQEASKAGYNLLLSNIALKSDLANEIFKDLSRRRIDGLILMGSIIVDNSEAQDSLNRFYDRHLPIVEISDHLNVHYDVDRLSSDYYAASLEAMTYLMELGHRRIGLVYGVAVPELGQDRIQPYMESLEKAGLPIEEGLIVQCGPTLEEGYQATLRMLAVEPRPTAVIVINDLLAIGAMRAIDDLGLTIPGDISVLSFDNIPMADYLRPRLTTVSKEVDQIAPEAIKLLLERIQEPGRPYQTRRYPAQLIVRESTGPPPDHHDGLNGKQIR